MTTIITVQSNPQKNENKFTYLKIQNKFIFLFK